MTTCDSGIEGPRVAARTFLHGTLVATLAAALLIVSSLAHPLQSARAGGLIPQDCDGLRSDFAPDERQWYRTDSTLVVTADGASLYVSVEHVGILKSIDNGSTWKRIVQGIAVDTLDKVTKRKCYGEYPVAIADPVNSKRVVFGMSCAGAGYLTSLMCKGGGVYETKNGGATWGQKITNKMNAYVTHAMAIDSRNTKLMYYGTSAAPQSMSGANPNKLFVKKGLIYKSTNGGTTWVELPTGFKKYERLVSIVLDPSDSNVITAGSVLMIPGGANPNAVLPHDRSLIQSSDGGASWAAVGNLPSSAKGIDSMVGSPTEGDHLFLSPVYRDVTPENMHSYFSRDRALTWTQTRFMDVFEYDPSSPSGDRIVAYLWSACQGECSKTLYESLDAGATWQTMGTLPSEIENVQNVRTRISKIVFDGSNSDVMYLAGSNAYVWKTTDRGLTWTTLLSLEKVRQQIK